MFGLNLFYPVLKRPKHKNLLPRQALDNEHKLKGFQSYSRGMRKRSLGCNTEGLLPDEAVRCTRTTVLFNASCLLSPVGDEP
jgi:hypothetical protein